MGDCVEEQLAQAPAFAELVAAPEADIAALERAGVLVPGATVGAWLLAYCAHLREQASGRAGSLAAARAALDNERREEVEARMAIKAGALLPVGGIGEALARACRQGTCGAWNLLMM
ncbi:MAG: hypothetical protein J0L57_20970 [Burkholderiales bacterium]|nr:hypothetical protein [Burkholderiales bacterium]